MNPLCFRHEKSSDCRATPHFDRRLRRPTSTLLQQPRFYSLKRAYVPVFGAFDREECCVARALASLSITKRGRSRRRAGKNRGNYVVRFENGVLRVGMLVIVFAFVSLEEIKGRGGYGGVNILKRP